ncbi:ankyrin repeats (3 copies) domain-containing protein [Apiospora rasikravindrae]|uniref:Ankyrin repeats (3 copies) domain-containing protein n=1 Tax=Apiospora rasikravindrae TaxID=990691 RepID=A0ABR1RT59_9PEZI
MDIFKLPGELVNEVLLCAVLSRDVNHSVKRALRLRLVCKLFAEAVYPALFRTCRLDDAIFECSFGGVEYRESRHGARELWHRYLVYRVAGEADPNVGRFVEIRELAQVLCEKDTSLNYESVIDTLLGAVTCDKTRPNTNILRRPQNNVVPDQGLNLLAAAVRLDMVSLVKHLLADGHDPATPNFLFPPATQVAAEYGNERVLRLLLEQTSRVVLEPYSIFGAAVGGDLAIMRLVFPPPPTPSPAAAEQSPPPADGTYGRIGIRHSFRCRLLSRALDATASPEVYEYLMQAWEPGYRPPRYEHVMCHAARGNIAMVRYLLDHQGEEGGVGVVDVNGADDVYHGSALSWACRHGHEEIVDMLLARGTDPNFAEEAHRSGLTLHAAVRGGYMSIVRKLLACGARVNGPHAAHRRTIHAAMQMEHTELVRLLIERGEPLGMVAEGLVKSMVNLGYESMLDILREYGFEPDRGAKPEFIPRYELDFSPSCHYTKSIQHKAGHPLLKPSQAPPTTCLAFSPSPEEILLEILKNLAQTPQSNVFFPECHEGKRKANGLDVFESSSVVIHYPHSGITTRYCSDNRPDTQRELAVDWLAINTTCRLLRRVGKEAFFRHRRFAMFLTSPGPLQIYNTHLRLPPPSTPHATKPEIRRQLFEMSQFLDLERIERIIFRLKVFPRLRHCTLLYAYFTRSPQPLPPRNAYPLLQAAVTDASGEDAEEWNKVAMPAEFRSLLHDIGVPMNVDIDLAIAKKQHPRSCMSDVGQIMANLNAIVYPILRIKGQALKRKAEAAASEKGV